MERWIDKVAVVTGASAGIGEAIVKLLVKEGLKVVGFARREERLKKLSEQFQNKTGKFYYVKVDVSKEEDIVAGFKWVTENVGPVHILINNAGIFHKNKLIDGDVAKWKQLVDVNVLGLSICTKEAVSIMMKNKIDGHIVHINSVVGHHVFPFPGVNMYAASKFAVTALRDTLQHELDSLGSKIKVTSLSPGMVKTEIGTADGFVPEEIFKEVYEKALLPEDVAEAVKYVLSTPPRVQIKELIITPLGES